MADMNDKQDSFVGWIIAIVVPSFLVIGYDILKLVKNIEKACKEKKERSKERKVLEYEE